MPLPQKVRLRKVLYSWGTPAPTYGEDDLLTIHAPAGDGTEAFKSLDAVCQVAADMMAMDLHCDVGYFIDDADEPVYRTNYFVPRQPLDVSRTIPGYFKNDDLASHLLGTATLMAKAAR